MSHHTIKRGGLKKKREKYSKKKRATDEGSGGKERNKIKDGMNKKGPIRRVSKRRLLEGRHLRDQRR